MGQNHAGNLHRGNFLSLDATLLLMNKLLTVLLAIHLIVLFDIFPEPNHYLVMGNNWPPRLA